MTGFFISFKIMKKCIYKDKNMADAKHEHGKMDTCVQEKTFDGFMSIVSKSAIVCILVLVFMALTNS